MEMLRLHLCILGAAIAAAAAGASVTVTVGDLVAGSDPVPPNFVGLSIEVGSVLKMMGSNGTKASFAQALRNLHQLTPGAHAGPVLRLGGNSADDSCFTGDVGDLFAV